MQKGRFPLKSSLVVVAIGASFWVGRASSPGVGEKAASDKVDSRSVAKGERRSGSAGRSGNAEGGTIKTAEDLRRLYKGSKGLRGDLMVTNALAKMSAAELAALAEEVSKTSGAGDGALSLVMGQWAELDPDAVLEFGLGSSNAAVKRSAVYYVFSGLGREDPTLGRQKLELIGDPAIRMMAQRELLGTMAAYHPDAYLEQIKTHPELVTRGASFMMAWAQDDPVLAAERLKSLPPRLQKDSIEILGKQWALTDPAAARKWAESLQDPDQKAKALSAAIGGMATKDPDGAIAALEGLELQTRTAALAGIFRTLAIEDPFGALERISTLPAADKLIALQQVSSWRSDGIGFDPAKISTTLAGLPAGETKNQMISQLGSSFAELPQKDFEQLLVALPASEQESLLKGAFQVLARQNPERAIAMMEGMPASPEKERMIRETISYMAGSAPEMAMKQVNELPQGASRDESMRSVLMSWVMNSPQAAIRYAESLSGPDRVVAISGLIPSVAWKDPAQAVRLYGLLAADPSGDSQAKQRSTRAAGNLASQWAKQDPVAATQWVASLPVGEDRSLAFKEAVYSWKRSDPAAARQAVEEASLPEDQKQSLLKLFDR